jgi:4-amino-4-deoxy-L-arabinose transferase-like glycosyltransferase
MSFLFKSDSKTGLWWIVPLSLLVIAITARIVISTYDTLDYDNYALMMGVEKPFSVYSSGGYGLPHYLHYWISYRIFGNSLYGYLVLPLLCSLATVVVVYRGLRRYWNSSTGVCFFTMAILVFNAVSLKWAGYTTVTYASSLLITSCLYFLFLELTTGKLAKKTWIWIFIVAVPAAFFSSILIIVPVVSGAFSVLVFRWWQSREYRRLKYVWQSLLDMCPLAVFLLNHLVIQIVHPFTNIGADKRPDLAPLYFNTSKYTQNLWGVVEYTFHNTATLIFGLLAPYGIGGDTMRPVWRFFSVSLPAPVVIIAVVVIVAVFVVLIIKALRNRLDPKATFTLVFVTVTFLAILTGGLTGLYPFGSARYADCLLIPVAVLIGYVAASVLQWIMRRIKARNSSMVWPLVLAALILISGIFLNWSEYRSISAKNNQNLTAFQEVRNTGAELVLYSAFLSPILASKTPDIHERGINFGWGSYYGNDSNNASANMAKAIESSADAGSILVVVRGEEKLIAEYLPLSDFLTANFEKTGSIEAPSFWAGYFVRK